MKTRELFIVESQDAILRAKFGIDCFFEDFEDAADISRQACEQGRIASVHKLVVTTATGREVLQDAGLWPIPDEVRRKMGTFRESDSSALDKYPEHVRGALVGLMAEDEDAIVFVDLPDQLRFDPSNFSLGNYERAWTAAGVPLNTAVVVHDLCYVVHYDEPVAPEISQDDWEVRALETPYHETWQGNTRRIVGAGE